jgi:uncharacterized protein (TIGR01440 family)
LVLLDLENIREQMRLVVHGLLLASNLKPGQIVVLGCSTSEVLGKRIGTSGSIEVATAMLEEAMACTREFGVHLAVQCCEHLNRALVVEQEVLDKYGLEQVTVYPVPRAGGAAAGMAMQKFHRPVVVESIQAHAGIDIGDTLIGMHLKPVAVPVRLPQRMIGEANVVAARTRPKLIGGQRAVYAFDQLEQKYGKTVIDGEASPEE